jgi:GH35 family endo-1,4-beta-xylanase
VLSLAISPHNGRVLYAATEGDGIYRSQDGGSTWSQYAWPGYIIADVLPDPDLPQRVYARVAYERIYVSDDDGATWTARWDSMPPTTEIMSLAVSPHDGDMLYAGAATELYRSRNRAVDWQRIGGELAGQSVFLVSMDVESPEIVYAGATKGIYRSKDAGATWQPWGTGLEDITVTALAMDPLNPGVAYVGTKHRGIYASYTGGQTWHPASTEEKDHTVHALQVSSDGHWLYAATDRGFQRTDLQEASTSRKYAPPGHTHFQAVPASWVPDLRAPRYGVHTLSADERTLPLVQAVGADTVVQLFPWWEIEPTKEQFIWQGADEAVAGAEYYGLNLVVRLDKHPEWANAKSPGPGQPPVDLVEYSHWVRRVVERYKHRVHAYIIWNEPNLALEWSGLPPDPQAYAELLKVGYAAVKEIDPDALVVSAGLAPTNTQNDEAMDDRLFLEALYEHGADDYFDVLGVHAYGFGYPPDDPRGAHGGLNLARTADLRDIMLRRGDGDKPVWITEIGWTTQGNEHSAWQEVTRQQQADYLRAALLGIRRNWPWVDLITIWNLGGEDNPDWGGYSLLEANGTRRPAYLALQSYLAGQGHGTLHADAPASVAPLELPHRYQVLAPDAIIHLGDNRLPAPWVPLYQDRNPSPHWRGTVYVHEPGEGSWQLTLRVMQSNFWSNRVWVNGQVLSEPLPLADFSKSWVSHTLTVPSGLLRPGPNEIRVTLAHATPLIQDKGFGYDKLQFKDVVLWK